MPSPEAILSNAEMIANRWFFVAIGWHAVIGTLLLLLITGWRPSRKLAGYLLAAPVMSAGVIAGATDSPFNASVFIALALLLIGASARFAPYSAGIGSRLQLIIGSLLVALGWMYPHFLNARHWTAYTYAAPLGLLPCPTLSAVIGLTLVLATLHSKTWSLALASVGVVYGVIGVFVLRVSLDYGLLAGSITLGAVVMAGLPTQRSGQQRPSSPAANTA